MLKAGTFDQDVPKHAQLDIEGQSDFTVFEVDENGTETAMIARSSDRVCRIKTRKDAKLRFKIAGKQFISINARPIPSDVEDVSDIPYEIPEDNSANLTLEEKLKRYLLEMVEERYGENSNEVETFEEAMDLEWEDDDPLAAFEPKPVIEEEPIDLPDPTPEPTPKPDPPEPETTP